MQPIIALFILLIIAVLGYSITRKYQKKKGIEERINYGFEDSPFNAEKDLSAGDYGLTGKMRFFYNLNEFLSSNRGRLTLFFAGAAFSGLTAFVLQKPTKMILNMTIGGGALLLVVGMLLLINNRKQRDMAIKSELPNALQTISAIMEGGLAFETACTHVIKESDPTHPLYFEMGVMMEAMQRGRRRNEALKLWAQRTNVAAVTDVVSGLIQADQTGASLGSVMKHHGQTLLRENEADIQRRAERLPVKMLFPMATMILPSVMIIAAGPSMVRIIQIMKELMGRA